jgi:hypothetical protein
MRVILLAGGAAQEGAQNNPQSACIGGNIGILTVIRVIPPGASGRRGTPAGNNDPHSAVLAPAGGLAVQN